MANLPKTTDYRDALGTEEVTSATFPADSAVSSAPAASVMNAPLPDQKVVTPIASDAPLSDLQATETQPLGTVEEARTPFPKMKVTRQSSKFKATAPAEEPDFSPTCAANPDGSPILRTRGAEPDPATPHSEKDPEPERKLSVSRVRSVRRYKLEPSNNVNQMPLAEQSSPLASSQPSLLDAPSGFVPPQLQNSPLANPQPLGPQANLIQQMQTYDMLTPTQHVPHIASVDNDVLRLQSSMSPLPPQNNDARQQMIALPNSQFQPPLADNIIMHQSTLSSPPPVHLQAMPISPRPKYSVIRDDKSPSGMPLSIPLVDRAPASQTLVSPPLFARSQPLSRVPARPPGVIIEHEHFKFALQLTHGQLQWILLGLFIMLALVMIPFWTACFLLHSSVFAFFAGYSLPICLLLLCVMLPILFVATMIVFFQYAPDTHQTAYVVCVIGGIFFTLLGAALILISMPLGYQAEVVSGDILFNCKSAPTTMGLYSTSNLLQQLRLQPSCTSAVSVDSCPGFATNQYTKVLQEMERQLQCSGFCSNSSSKLDLLQVSGSQTELVSREPSVIRSMKRAKGRLWSRLQNRALGISSKAETSKQVPNQTSTAVESSYPLTLFSQHRFRASCSGMAANLFSGFVGDVARQVYIVGIILMILAVPLSTVGFWGPRLGTKQPFEY